jgi:hypothetical protein
MSVVKSLYTKGDNTSITNYRPMSLLMVLSKVLEKALHSRLYRHLHANNRLVKERYGCRKGISTEDAAFRLTSSSSSSSSSLFFSINPIIDTYHEDVEIFT